MKNDFQNDGSAGVGWLTDAGAREAKLDGQGFLKEEPIREGPESDYDRLMRLIYDAAHRAAAKTPAWNFISLETFAEELAKDSLYGAAQISTAVRDAYRLRQKEPTLTVPHGLYSLTLENEVFHDVNPPSDDTPSEEFTEEEIAEVTAAKFHAGLSYKQIAKEYHIAAENERKDGFNLCSKLLLSRARCAEHLAKQEEGNRQA